MVVDERDDARVERALVGAQRAADVVGERLVALADAARGACRRRRAGQAGSGRGQATEQTKLHFR